MSLVSREPAALAMGLLAIIESGIALGVAFGLGWTAEQTAAVVAFSTTVLALGGGLFVRSKVTPS